MEFLGHVVSVDGIYADPQQVEAVANWEQDDQMRSQYPHLFHDTGTNFVDEIFL